MQQRREALGPCAGGRRIILTFPRMDELRARELEERTQLSRSCCFEPLAHAVKAQRTSSMNLLRHRLSCRTLQMFAHVACPSMVSCRLNPKKKTPIPSVEDLPCLLNSQLLTAVCRIGPDRGLHILGCEILSAAFVFEKTFQLKNQYSAYK